MNFWDRMQEVINQGVEASRDMLNKAGEKAKDLGEKGIIRYEIMKLEKQAERDFILLGSKVFGLLEQTDIDSVQETHEEIKPLVDEIRDIRQKIEQKEEQLKNI